MIRKDEHNSIPRCVFELSPTGVCTFLVQADSAPCVGVCQVRQLSAEFGEAGLADNQNLEEFKFFLQGMVEKVNLTTDPNEEMNG